MPLLRHTALVLQVLDQEEFLLILLVTLDTESLITKEIIPLEIHFPQIEKVIGKEEKHIVHACLLIDLQVEAGDSESLDIIRTQ